MSLKLFVFFVWLRYAVHHVDSATDKIEAMIVKEGYPVELHTLITADGYTVALHRIVPKKPTKNVVLMMHGLCSSAGDFLLLGRNRALGFILSDAGYDVWLASSRAEYSQNHTELDATKDAAQYWHFSFHEFGIYDLPAMIDFILRETSTPKLHYVGLSQGCTSLLTMLAELPAYNSKIVSVHFLAPSIVLKHTNALFRFTANNMYEIQNAVNTFQIYEIPMSVSNVNMLKMACQNPSLQRICQDTVFAIFGRSDSQFNSSIIYSILTDSLPMSGTSVRQFLHFAKLIRFNKFGPLTDNNGSTTADSETLYNLQNVQAKFQIIYGSSDILATPIDIEKLVEMLGPALVIDTLKVAGFNHIDVAYGMDAHKLIYPRILKVMNGYKIK